MDVLIYLQPPPCSQNTPSRRKTHWRAHGDVVRSTRKIGMIKSSTSVCVACDRREYRINEVVVDSFVVWLVSEQQEHVREVLHVYSLTGMFTHLSFSLSWDLRPRKSSCIYTLDLGRFVHCFLGFDTDVHGNKKHGPTYMLSGFIEMWLLYVQWCARPRSNYCTHSHACIIMHTVPLAILTWTDYCHEWGHLHLRF